MVNYLTVLFLGIYCACACSRGALAAQELEPGLVGEYFNIGEEITDFPSLEGKKVALKRVEKQVNYETTDENFYGTDLKDQFAIRFTGLIRVPKDAKYKFFTNSDDGSRLFIDGKQVVDNGGLHGMEEKEGEIDLKAGDHEIKIEFFQNGGGAGIKASWEAEGIPKEIISDKVFFHFKGTEK